jgi:hypothetical protein
MNLGVLVIHQKFGGDSEQRAPRNKCADVSSEVPIYNLRGAKKVSRTNVNVETNNGYQEEESCYY